MSLSPPQPPTHSPPFQTQTHPHSHSHSHVFLNLLQNQRSPNLNPAVNPGLGGHGEGARGAEEAEPVRSRQLGPTQELPPSRAPPPLQPLLTCHPLPRTPRTHTHLLRRRHRRLQLRRTPPPPPGPTPPPQGLLATLPAHRTCTRPPPRVPHRGLLCPLRRGEEGLDHGHRRRPRSRQAGHGSRRRSFL